MKSDDAGAGVFLLTVSDQKWLSAGYVLSIHVDMTIYPIIVNYNNWSESYSTSTKMSWDLLGNQLD